MNAIKFRMAARCEAAGRPETINEDSFQMNDNLTSGRWSADENSNVLLFDTDKTVQLGEKGALMVVCDGMGGMNAGEVASQLAIETVESRFKSSLLTDELISSPEKIINYIEKTIIAADNSIKNHSAANKEHEGMGSTIVLAWIINNTVYVGWCGDSRAYRYNPADGLKQLSHDHSYVQELVDQGKLSEELAFDHPQNNIITRSLGDSQKEAKPEVKYFNLREDDIILLCSDGLCGVLRNRKIEDVIQCNTNSMKSCRDALWNAVSNADWHDNVTIGLCQILPANYMPVAMSALQTNDIQYNKYHFRFRSMLVPVLCLVILALSVALFYKPNNKQEKVDEEKERVIQLIKKVDELNKYEFEPDTKDFLKEASMYKNFLLENSNKIDNLDSVAKNSGRNLKDSN
jgi:serine/threonine protein phosphatase PrpC